MSSFLVRTIADIGHQSDTLKFSSNTRINTLWSAPTFLTLSRMQDKNGVKFNHKDKEKQLNQGCTISTKVGVHFN